MSEPDPAAVYEVLRQRFLDLLATADIPWIRRVPATPDWAIHDVLSHVVGLCTELNALHFPDEDDPGAERWSRALVEARKHATFASLRDEWDREAPTFEDGLRAFGYEFGSHFAADLHAHVQDVHEAMGLPEEDDPDAVRVSLDHYLGFVDERLRELGGAIEIAGQRTLGDGPPLATLDTPPFVLMRVLSARRSLRQVRGLDWSGDVDRALELLSRVYVGGYSFPADAG